MRTRTEAAAYAADWAESAHRAWTRARNARAFAQVAAAQPEHPSLGGHTADQLLAVAADDETTCRLDLDFARTWAAIAAALPEEN